jgi:hypothetical protein
MKPSLEELRDRVVRWQAEALSGSSHCRGEVADAYDRVLRELAAQLETETTGLGDREDLSQLSGEQLAARAERVFEDTLIAESVAADEYSCTAPEHEVDARAYREAEAVMREVIRRLRGGAV